MAAGALDDIERFHRWSRTYERSLGQFFLFDRVHRAVADLASGEGSPGDQVCVLDVGCGTGRFLRKAALRWPTARLVGVDPAEGMIEHARRLTPSATFHIGRGEALPLADASVDLAFSTISFHHWADQAAGVREVARVLKPGGRFFLADGSIPAALAGLIRHSRVHTAVELKAMFEAAGLSIRTQKTVLAGIVLATIGQKHRSEDTGEEAPAAVRASRARSVKNCP